MDEAAITIDGEFSRFRRAFEPAKKDLTIQVYEMLAAQSCSPDILSSTKTLFEPVRDLGIWFRKDMGRSKSCREIMNSQSRSGTRPYRILLAVTETIGVRASILFTWPGG